MAIGKPCLRTAGLATLLALGLMAGPLTVTGLAAPAGAGYTVVTWATGVTSGCAATGNDASSPCYFNAGAVTTEATTGRIQPVVTDSAVPRV